MTFYIKRYALPFHFFPSREESFPIRPARSARQYEGIRLASNAPDSGR
jgi:hypothetical protein